MEYDKSDQAMLLSIAAKSIQHFLKFQEDYVVNTSEISAVLNQPAACFVTLMKQHQLRGCIGSLTARQALAYDVAENAKNAAFSDPRFPKLDEAEFPLLEIQISVLSKPEKMLFHSEEDLINQIQPNIDGLILQDKFNRSTFLPTVWESLPDKKDFLTQLKRKAGLSENYWSDTLSVERYSTFCFGDEIKNISK